MPELIDRQSALSVCKEYCWLDDEDFIEGYNTAIKDIREAINELPTIEPEVRRGHWIPVDGEPYAKCSYCGEKHYGCTTPYCDMCGAYMRKEGESDA